MQPGRTGVFACNPPGGRPHSPGDLPYPPRCPTACTPSVPDVQPELPQLSHRHPPSLGAAPLKRASHKLYRRLGLHLLLREGGAAFVEGALQCRLDQLRVELKVVVEVLVEGRHTQTVFQDTWLPPETPLGSRLLASGAPGRVATPPSAVELTWLHASLKSQKWSQNGPLGHGQVLMLGPRLWRL